MPPQPEFLIDRNLGKRLPRLLRENGWQIHLIADLYPDDAQQIGDPEWVAEACLRGWIPLCKDGRIVGRDHEFQPVIDHKNVFFFLNSQGLTIQEMFEAVHGARAAIDRAIDRVRPAAYAITRQGNLERRWPPPAA